MAELGIPIQAEMTLLQRHQWIKRRVEPRYHCGPATAARVLHRVGGEAPRRVWILNLSATGAGIQAAQPLEAETLIVINLRSVAQDRVFDLPARVVHCTQQVNGEWLIGCEFADQLSPDDLDALL